MNNSHHSEERGPLVARLGLLGGASFLVGLLAFLDISYTLTLIAGLFFAIASMEFMRNSMRRKQGATGYLCGAMVMFISGFAGSFLGAMLHSAR